MNLLLSVIFIMLSLIIFILILKNQHLQVFIKDKFYTFNVKRLYDKSKMLYLKCSTFYGQYLPKPVIFMVDTGADNNYISEKFVSEYYSDYNKHIELGDDVLSVNGKMTLNRLLDVPIQFDNGMKIKEHFTLLTETHSLDYLTSECGYEVVGILGTNFLKKYKVTINFTSMSIIAPK